MPPPIPWQGKRHKSLRQPDDFYPSPPGAASRLLGAESFEGGVWEPACGDGALSREIEAAGITVVSTDLVARGVGQSRVDFLMEHKLLAPNIVTNPPFKLAEQFARHALDLGAMKVCLLLRLVWLAGQRRRDLHQRLARVHVFSGRLTMRRDDSTDVSGGMIDYAWFCWDKNHSGPPVLNWI